MSAVDAVSPAAKRRRTNFLARFWRGEINLIVSFWLIWFVANLALFLFIAGLRPIFDASNPRAIFALLAVFWIATIVVQLWLVVGTWRSASNYIRVRRTDRKITFWGYAAQVVLVLRTIQFVTLIGTAAAPMLNEGFRIGFLGDPDVPAYSVVLLDDGTTLRISGGIKYGLEEAVETALDANPGITTIRLSSPGGRLWPAMAVNHLIRERGLDTASYFDCSSACTVILVAGEQRTIGRGAQIGFHSATFAGLQAEDAAFVNSDYATLLRQGGVSTSFIAEALDVAADDMWFPTPTQLLAAGVVGQVVDEYPDDEAPFIVAGLVAELAAGLPLESDDFTLSGLSAPDATTLRFEVVSRVPGAGEAFICRVGANFGLFAAGVRVVAGSAGGTDLELSAADC